MPRVAARTLSALQAMVASGGDLFAAWASTGDADVASKPECGRDPFVNSTSHAFFFGNVGVFLHVSGVAGNLGRIY